jgi:hypothetical protein
MMEIKKLKSIRAELKLLVQCAMIEDMYKQKDRPF